MENILKIAPVRAGAYFATKVLDCYYEKINTCKGEKEILRFILKVPYKNAYHNVDIVTFCNDYEYSEYQILINKIAHYFELEEFDPECLICRYVNVDLTTRTDNKGNEYMKIINIFPYKSNQ